MKRASGNSRMIWGTSCRLSGDLSINKRVVGELYLFRRKREIAILQRAQLLLGNVGDALEPIKPQSDRLQQRLLFQHRNVGMAHQDRVEQVSCPTAENQQGRRVRGGCSRSPALSSSGASPQWCAPVDHEASGGVARRG